MNKKRSGCIGCGGPCLKECVDNRGNKYMGCSSGCRFKTQAEMDAEYAAAMSPIPALRDAVVEAMREMHAYGELTGCRRASIAMAALLAAESAARSGEG